MPVRNGFYGAYKTLQVRQNGVTQYLIAESASRKREMEARQRNFIQGTALNRIMDVGGLKEQFSINAPILIGGGSTVDGRTLINNAILDAINPSYSELPILSGATITISAEQGGSVQVQMLSDGSPQAGVFDVQSGGKIAGTSLSGGSVADVLDPSTNMPTRVAKFYDFRVNLAGFYLFVKEGSITVQVQTKPEYFLGGKLGDGESFPAGFTSQGSNDTGSPWPGYTPGTNGASPTIDLADNPANWGTQYPWLGVGGISITGRGKAVVLIQPGDNPGDPDFAINYNQSGANTDVTLQYPGMTRTVSQDFTIEVYRCPSQDFSSGGAWVSLFADSSGNPLFDLSKSIVTATNFNVSAELITIDFDFSCYVQPGTTS